VARRARSVERQILPPRGRAGGRLARCEKVVEPNSVDAILTGARERAAEHQETQVRRLSQALGRDVEEVAVRLEAILDRVEVRVTRGLSVCRYLRDELEAGRVPTIRSVFETGRQDHTNDPATVAGIIVFRRQREGGVFGAEVESMDVEDRPKYGFAWFEATPTEPLPFGPICFILNLDNADLRECLTLTPVDSSIPDLTPEEVGTLDHPLNAFARSSDALRACGLIGEAMPPEVGVRDNARQGTPEAQVWGPLRVTADQIQAIMAEVASADDQDLAHLRVVAERQGIPLVVRVLRGP
jgi:hypothetical protein